jgi:hypothetical protein
MNNMQSYIVNKDLPSAGFGNGKLKDESAPLADDGSSVTVQTHNDYYYGFHAPIKKYLPAGDVSDTDESDTASDVRDAAEYMVGIKVDTVSEWDVAVGYGLDVSVIHRGIQFVSMTAGNLGKDPFTNPSLWLPCHERNDAFIKWQKGEDIRGGFDILHNYRDAGYRQNFGWGGINYEAFGVHLDGTQITGNATLEAIFDVGGGNEYHLLDVVAPDVVGVRTLLDARGAAAAVVDAIAGDRANVGVYQDDAGQGHHHNQEITAGATKRPFATNGATAGTVINALTDTVSSLTTGNKLFIVGPITDGVNGTPRTDSETRMKNYSVGVPAVLVINPV